MTTNVTPADRWNAVEQSADFIELRRLRRRFVFPMAAAFLLWYALYVLCADYAHGFMSKKVLGNITVGLIFGLLQFVSTFLITTLYVRFADKRLDPLAEKLRAQMEDDGIDR